MGRNERFSADMNLNDIARLRLISQQIVGSKLKSVKETVEWMGAMQAQDFGMSKWAIGVRLPGSTDRMIETALNKGEILRVHLLRPTWHFVSANDIRWLLELTAPRIKASLRSRHNQLGLTATIFAESNSIIAQSLKSGKHLSREELMAELRKSKIPLDENRASHLLVQAELDGIICSGSSKNGKQTYALLDERVPTTKSLPRKESSAQLARIFFTSRCPATLQDFVWWSGMTIGDVKMAIEMIKSDFIPETIGSKVYWFPKDYSIPGEVGERVLLLPAFDEFIISYTDRLAILGENLNKIVISNGIFRPVIMVDGRVTGIWKRVIGKNNVSVEINCFRQPNATARNLIEKAFQQYGRFLEKELEIAFK
jgi:hypothetical protein